MSDKSDKLIEAEPGYLVITTMTDGRSELMFSTIEDVKAYVEETTDQEDEIGLILLQVFKSEAVYMTPQGRQMRQASESALDGGTN